MTPGQWRSLALDAAWLVLSAALLWLYIDTRDPVIQHLGIVVAAVDVARLTPWWKQWRFGDDNPDNSTR